jgi:hypothetical protein
MTSTVSVTLPLWAETNFHKLAFVCIYDVKIYVCVIEGQCDGYAIHVTLTALNTSSVSASEVDSPPLSSWTTRCQHSEMQLHTAFLWSSDLITVCIVPSKPHYRYKANCFFVHTGWNSCMFHPLLLASGAQCFMLERPLFITAVSRPFSCSHYVMQWSLIFSSTT